MEKVIEIFSPEIGVNWIRWEVKFNGQRDSFETKTSANVAPMLVSDRIDAVVMGLLIFAIRNGFDFKSELPITDELLYNLRNHLLPSIGKFAHVPIINAPTITPVKLSGHIVATGISCGVDSLYTIATHTNLPFAKGNLTHLAFFDAGSHHSDKDTSLEKEGHRKKAIEFAETNGFEYFEVRTSLPEMIERNAKKGYSHIENHTFMMLHCVLTIARGIVRYYYSSGHEYNDFNCNFDVKSDYDASQYDLLTLFCSSYGETKFLSAGGQVSRLGKIQLLSKYRPAFESLNVCISTVDNCGKCFKCVRTMLELDAIGALNSFSEVFDVDSYARNRGWYLKKAYIGALLGDVFMQELLPYFSREITIWMKISAILEKTISVLKNRLF